jgi:hypothetical protein
MPTSSKAETEMSKASSVTSTAPEKTDENDGST